MRRFLRVQPGPRSRFAREIVFPDYATDELVAITERFARDLEYELGPGAEDVLRRALRSQPARTELRQRALCAHGVRAGSQHARSAAGRSRPGRHGRRDAPDAHGRGSGGGLCDARRDRFGPRPRSLPPTPSALGFAPCPTSSGSRAAEVLERARVTGFMRRHGYEDFRAFQQRSQDEPEWFWPAAIEDMGLEFRSPWRQVLDALPRPGVGDLVRRLHPEHRLELRPSLGGATARRRGGGLSG